MRVPGLICRGCGNALSARGEGDQHVVQCRENGEVRVSARSAGVFRCESFLEPPPSPNVRVILACGRELLVSDGSVRGAGDLEGLLGEGGSFRLGSVVLSAREVAALAYEGDS